MEVGMLERINSIDSGPPVKSKQFFQQRYTSWAQFPECLPDSRSFVTPISNIFAPR